MVAGNNARQLQGSGRRGDFVLNTQTTAEADGFGHVSRAWFEQTMSIDQELDRLAASAAKRERLEVSFARMMPDAADEKFFVDVDGRRLFPDAHAAKQLGAITGVGTHYVERLAAAKRVGDADALAFALEHAWPTVDAGKRYVLHVEDADVLRGIVPESRLTVRNEWYLGFLQRTIPGGRLSHWRGDDYTITGNVLVPDSIRQEDDSEYGAMLSVGNSIIGLGSFRQRPSLFRAICMNGCIWDQTKGQQVHLPLRGNPDLGALEKFLAASIRQQIPLAVAGLDRLLRTRAFTTAVNMKPVIAQLSHQYRLRKSLASAVLRSWWVEKRETPGLDNTLFAVVNAVTRAGQSQENDTWLKFDALGGKLAHYDQNDWNKLVSRAAELDAKQVDGAFEGFAIAT